MEGKATKTLTKYVDAEVLLEEHLTYLDELRESGETNMFGARPYLQSRFPKLSQEEAKEILVYWMRTFGERHE